MNFFKRLFLANLVVWFSLMIFLFFCLIVFSVKNNPQMIKLTGVEFIFKYMSLFSLVSIFFLLVISSIYFVIFKFYINDYFYLYISLAWVFNAIYIGFEGYYPLGNITYNSIVFFISIVSTSFFFFAFFSLKYKKIPRKRFSFQLAFFVLITFGWFFLSILLFNFFKIEAPTECMFATSLIGGILFSFYSLIGIGIKIPKKFIRKEYKLLPSLFSSTFIIYAYIQFIYLIKLFGEFQTIIHLTFLLALIIKILNCLFIVNIVKIDFQLIQEESAKSEAFKRLGEISAIIGHDILTPTTVISVIADRLGRKFSHISGVGRIADSISYQLRKIRGAVDVIDISRLSKEILDLGKVSLNDSIRRAMNAVKAVLYTENIHFIFKPRITYFVLADRLRLEEAFINIFTNSVEAIKHRKGMIEIKILPSKEDVNYCRIEILDNGAGISEKNIDNVKKIGYSVGKPKKINKGLGLYMADILINLHDGKLTITSEPKKYTRVTIILPKYIKEK